MSNTLWRIDLLVAVSTDTAYTDVGSVFIREMCVLVNRSVGVYVIVEYSEAD